jgi:hypothetical protein
MSRSTGVGWHRRPDAVIARRRSAVANRRDAVNPSRGGSGRGVHAAHGPAIGHRGPARESPVRTDVLQPSDCDATSTVAFVNQVSESECRYLPRFVIDCPCR